MEEKPSSLPIPFFPFSPLRSILRHSPLSEHLKQASATRNAAIHKEIFFYSAIQRTQRFLEELHARRDPIAKEMW